MNSHAIPTRSWRRTANASDASSSSFLISTDHSLLNHVFINTAFANEDMYWAKPLPTDQLVLMLSQSQAIGLYRIHSSLTPATADPASPSSPRDGEQLEQIGMARFVTDYVTLTYLTDVFVLPEYRQAGLGKWLIACCKEMIQAVPALRRAVLVASPGVGKAFYERELGFHDAEEERAHCVIMTKRGYEI